MGSRECDLVVIEINLKPKGIGFQMAEKKVYKHTFSYLFYVTFPAISGALVAAACRERHRKIASLLDKRV